VERKKSFNIAALSDMVVNRTFEYSGSAFQQSDPAAFTSFLFHGKHGSRLIATRLYRDMMMDGWEETISARSLDLH
jgi:hypothetical protein